MLTCFRQRREVEVVEVDDPGSAQKREGSREDQPEIHIYMESHV